VTDGINTQVLPIGIDPSGTDEFDLGLDVLAPPMPPAGAFGTLLEWKNEQYFKDIRDNTTNVKKFVLRYQSQTGGSIVLSWDSSSLSLLGDFQIVDDITGTLFSFNMMTADSLEISSSQFITDKLRIVVNIDLTGTENHKDQSPIIYLLEQNYPNPFNSLTLIKFTLLKSEYTTLKVFNIVGKEVTTIKSDKLNQGNHAYEFDGINLASGVYYYQLVAGEYREVKKMILLK